MSEVEVGVVSVKFSAVTVLLARGEGTHFCVMFCRHIEHCLIITLALGCQAVVTSPAGLLMIHKPPRKPRPLVLLLLHHSPGPFVAKHWDRIRGLCTALITR